MCIRDRYRRSHDGILLRCLSQKEAHEVLKEAHDGMCGAHNLVQNLHIDSKGWDIIGLRCLLTPSLMQKDVTPVKYMAIYPSSTRISSPYDLYLAV